MTDQPDQPITWNESLGPSFSIKATQPTALTIMSNEGWSVSISMADGSITYGDGYKPEEAAKIFWEAIAYEYRDFKRWREERANAYRAAFHPCHCGIM